MQNRRIVYLDQNKWIALARAAKYPRESLENRAVLEFLCSDIEAGRIILPLTATNVYETHKINSFERRFDLAYCQVALSEGMVFRGRYKRLEFEVTDAVRRAYGLPCAQREENWFLSNIFYESTAEWNDPRLGPAVSQKLVNLVRDDPKGFLFRFWMETPEEVRKAAVRKYSEGSDTLQKQIEERRRRHATESKPMRRNIHSAMLMINELDLIQSFVERAGVPDLETRDILSKHAPKIIDDTPTYHIERELALRLEAQENRPIKQNDLRDMQSFTAVIAYADIVVAENQFSSLARQAGLDRHFNTLITSDLSELKEQLV